MIMNDILCKIKDSKKLCISCHTSPDGDAIGSVLALGLGLKNFGKEVCILSKEPVPGLYSFLPGSDLIDETKYTVPEDADCVVILDCGNLERINAELKLDEKKYTLINIDHHLSNDMYGDLNFIDTNAAAVGEIVYQMLKILGILIDKDIAMCLYTSIVTDTGSFRFSNTTSVTHTIAGDLINCGVDVSETYRVIYENKKLQRIRLYGAAIEGMKMYHENKICIMKISREMQEKLNLQDNSDISDVLTFGMQIDTVDTAALIKEIPSGVKISLRSKAVVDVRKVAEAFGGGGHVRAAGLSMNESLQEAEKLILKTIENELT